MTFWEGFAQIVGEPSQGGRGFGQIVITFIVAKESLIYSLFCSIYGIHGGGGWFKTSYGGRGLAKNVRIPSYRREEI